jgi:hypothetical protein
VATILSLIASIVFVLRARGVGRKSKRKLAKEDLLGFATSRSKQMEPDPLAARSLKQRIPAWGRHIYTQVEKQPSVARGGSFDDDRQRLVPSDVKPNLGEEEADYEHGYTHAEPNGMIMQSFRSQRGRDVNTAYEPYRP